MKSFFAKCYIKPTLVIGFVIVLGVILGRYILVDTWLKLLLGSFAIAVFYMLITYFLVLTKEEKKLICVKIFKKRKCGKLKIK